MGVSSRHPGPGMFSVFLKAQETSPTLVLRHAGIGDEGALEVSRFLAFNPHLVRVDLTGNNITSTGAMHLAQAIRQNVVLESLVLRHNALAEGGDDGLRKLCEAVRGSASLRHLDIGRNGLAGSLAAERLGDMLRGNTALTHVELSWNPLDPAGGQVLLGHVTQNTTLFDCQLTGCGVAEETMLGIAQLLKRNRAARGADLQAGPYRVAVLEAQAPRVLCPHAYEPGAATALSRSVDIGACDVPAPGPMFREEPTNAVVSGFRTAELKEKLLEWRRVRLFRSQHEDTNDVHELLEHLDRFQAALDEEVEELGKVRTHTECVTRGYHDRVMRYQFEVTEKQDLLLEAERERKELHGTRQRAAEELKLQQEAADEAVESLESLRKLIDADEARSRHDLAAVQFDTRACEMRLAELTDQAEHGARENARLRARANQLRDGIVVMRPRPIDAVMI